MRSVCSLCLFCSLWDVSFFFFFFQAEDGIRDHCVTGVQTCALPIYVAWWTDGSLDWFWAACEKARLPIGLLAGGNMAALAKVAERHPGLKLHIDHLGRLGGGRAGTDDAAFADLPDMLALAKFPNVAVKMSGAPSYSSQPYPFRNVHGYLRQVFEAFGPERSFWGTDITRMPCSYRQCV